MKPNDAGEPASSAPMTAEVPKTISPAARKFAEYLARHMAPMIESAAAKRTEATQQPNGAVAVYTQRKGD
jgi:hypothetical protein